jgi:DNA sulfur modification protein DndB
MMKKNEELLVPAMTGVFGEWRYYQIIMTVKELVKNISSTSIPEFRIKTVDEVEEIYSKKGVSNLLQRAYDPTRLDPIKNYILTQKERYLNNLTVGVFGGSPDWLEISISTNDENIKNNIDELKEKLGFIRFDGSETLFVLDGQHRLKSLRKAFEKNPDKIKDDEIVLTLILHQPNDDGRIKTRRLFSTINRQAKPVSHGENILLDEDDVSSIIVRDLIENYKEFKNKEIIALSKGANITSRDKDRFTSVVNLWNINEKIIKPSIYTKIDNKPIKIRPKSSVIDSQRGKVFKFWDKFFELLPSAKKFLNETKKNREKARINGGDFSLRPIAQIAIIEVLLSVEDFNDNNNIDKIKKLPLLLSNNFWHYILWNPHKLTMLSNRGLVIKYIKYNIGIKLTDSELKSMTDSYKKNSGELELKLPEPKYKPVD